MKRNPGEWLRDRILDRNQGVALHAVAGAAWLVGAASGFYVGFAPAALDQWSILVLALPGAAFLGRALHLGKRGWRLPDMRKDARAEQAIGQAIERALTRGSCAVAHHVAHEGVALVGDIDHLVATPDGLWVIETKHGRVPRQQFRRALWSIAVNVGSVRKWAPGVRVTGCLVFASEQRERPKPAYEYENETIKAFAGRSALMRALRQQARRTGGSLELARRVWELGGLPDDATNGKDS